jgi:flagella basal body P-ring formation protein FlgA
MIALFLALLQPAACHALHSDIITGRDLAEAVPALAGLTPDVAVGLAPVPGRQRVFTPAELKRIGVAQHLDVQAAETTCFEWSLAIPDSKDMVAAMRRSFADREVQIKVEEQSLSPAPQGQIVFPLAALAVGSENSVVWRGYVEYAEKRRFSIWARVSIRVKEQRVATTANLKAGEPVNADQIKLQKYEGPITRTKFLSDPASAVGMIARRSITAGAELSEDILEPPMEVASGETVTAIVENGGARLVVQGVAESAGRRGQVINVRNPRSGRSFHARVEEKGTVLLVPGGQYGLVPEPRKS